MKIHILLATMLLAASCTIKSAAKIVKEDDKDEILSISSSSSSSSVMTKKESADSKEDASGTSSDISLLSEAIKGLTPTILTEPHSGQVKRKLLEDTISKLLKTVDLSKLSSCLIEGENINIYLKNRGYQIIGRELLNRFSVHRKRYADAFKHFLAQTNEKVVINEFMNNFMTKLHHAYSDYFNNGIRIFDIGFGDGEFSAATINTLAPIVPDGLGKISFSGIELQDAFVKSGAESMLKLGIANPNLMLGDFNKPLLEKLKKSANLVIASHTCYTFPNVIDFVNKCSDIMEDNGITIFIHTSDGPIDAFRLKYPAILRQRISNTNEKISHAISECRLESQTIAIQPSVRFPIITEEIWEQLKSVQTYVYDTDYSPRGPIFNQAKNLLEFFLLDPLEAFTQEERNILLTDFKALLASNDNCIKLNNTIQIVVSKSANPLLKKAIDLALT